MRQLLLLAGSSAALLAAAPALAQTPSSTAATQPTPADAQPRAGDPGPADPALEEVVVTGSRVARSRLDTTAPVDVVTTTSLQQQATPELGQALANLVPSIDFPRPAITDGTDSVRPATLRGLSPDQTLVLLNGQRQHASALVNVNGSIGRGAAAVDLNTIPTVALERVEVLRDGASAQYGSDAIAGVINLILRKASSGGEITGQFGGYDTDVVTARNPGGRHASDGNVYDLYGWQGFKLGSEGFLTLSAEYSYRNPTNRGDLDPRVAGPLKVTSRYGDPEIESIGGFANAGAPINATWSWEAFAGYQHREGNSAANPRLANNANNVPAIFPDGFLPKIGTQIDDYSLSGGLKGEWRGFTVDAHLSYGDNRVEYTTFDTVNASRGASSPTSFYSGAMQYGQFVAALDVVRPLNFSWSRKTNLAFGAEFRNETYGIEAGEPGSYDFGGAVGKGAGAQGFPGFKPSNEVSRDRQSGSLYADLDVQLTEKLDVDVAGRFESYSDFGETATGKIAARYDFTNWFALRGAFSTGFRAPSLQQQFFTATSTNFITINGLSTPVDVGTFPATAPVSLALGGKQLDPEESTNVSVGGVFRWRGLELTVDAYHIDIDDRIVLSENIQGAPTGTATAVAIYNLINSTPGSQLGAARFFINGVETTTEGLDVVGRYRLRTEQFGRFDFTGALNLNHTDVNRVPTTAQLSALPVPPVLFDRLNRLTFEKGTPQQKYVGSVDYGYGPVGFTFRATKYGSVLVPSNASQALDYKTGAHTIVDLEARLQLPWRSTVALGVNNVTDEYPDPTPVSVNTNGPIGFSSYSPFGFNGRFLYLRLSKGW